MLSKQLGARRRHHGYVSKAVRAINNEILGPPATVVKCISMIYDILERVPAKGNEQRYDPNMFDPTYDYGGDYSFKSIKGIPSILA